MLRATFTVPGPSPRAGTETGHEARLDSPPSSAVPRPRLRRSTLLAACLALLPGCGDVGDSSAEAPASDAPVVRDSAGIRIVENTDQPVWSDADAWYVGEEPTLSIGGLEGEVHETFGYALAPTRMSDGRVVVADRQVNHIHFYDASGQHLQTVGRTGQGPGEFSQIWRMRRIQGDSLMVLNPSTLTSIFTPEGEFVRRYSLDPIPTRTNIWWKGRFPDGTMLAFSLAQKGTRYVEDPDGEGGRRIERPDRGPLYRDSLLHFIYTGDGTLVDSLMEIPGQWLGQNRVYPPNEAYLVEGDLFFSSPGNEVAIQTWRYMDPRVEPSPTTPAGLLRLERIVRRPALHDQTVTAELKEAVYEGIREKYRGLADQGIGMEGAQYEIDATVFPDRIPAHGRGMHADAEGNLWLEEYEVAGLPENRWSVFDPDGRWLGVVRMPDDFTVNEIGRDYVLGIQSDELGVQYVRQFPLIKPE